MKKELGVVDTKKAQAAMEFLMTYGWALLVVLVALGALVYFGIGTTGSFLPDSCILPTGFSCINPYATATAGAPNPLTLTIQNGLGYQLGALNVTIDVQGVLLPAAAADCIASPPTVASGETVTCGYQLSAGAAIGSTLKGLVNLNWIDSQGNGHSRTGTLSLTIEQ